MSNRQRDLVSCMILLGVTNAIKTGSDCAVSLSKVTEGLNVCGDKVEKTPEKTFTNL